MEVIPPQPPQHQNQARFVPPLVNISSNYSSNLNNLNNNNIIINNMNTNSNNSNNSNNSDLDYGSDFDSDDSSSQSQSQWNAYIDRNNGSANNKSNNNSKANNKVNGTKTRGTSGRKPLRNDKVYNHSNYYLLFSIISFQNIDYLFTIIVDTRRRKEKTTAQRTQQTGGRSLSKEKNGSHEQV